MDDGVGVSGPGSYDVQVVEVTATNVNPLRLECGGGRVGAGEAGDFPVSIAGARHSMGGDSIAPGGIVIDMRPWRRMRLEEDRDLLTVQSGATWAEIIPYLDARGRSVAVMQSNNSFTVGGSLSVNCHGWAYGRPPIASTVDSFRLMKADGTVVRLQPHRERGLLLPRPRRLRPVRRNP